MIKSLHKTSGKWKKKMRKCCTPTIKFLVLETVSMSVGTHISLRKCVCVCVYMCVCVCVCVCVCLSVLLDRVILSFTLIFSMAENIHVCQLYLWCVLETRRDHRGSGLKAGPGFLGTLALLCSSVPVLVGAVCPSCVLP